MFRNDGPVLYANGSLRRSSLRFDGCLLPSVSCLPRNCPTPATSCSARVRPSANRDRASFDDAKTRHHLDQYALIGGFAVSVWSVPRATHDVDFALALGSSDPAALSRLLQAEFQPGEPDDPLRVSFERASPSMTFRSQFNWSCCLRRGTPFSFRKWNRCRFLVARCEWCLGRRSSS